MQMSELFSKIRGIGDAAPKKDGGGNAGAAPSGQKS
jgi:hypothetical protein